MLQNKKATNLKKAFTLIEILVVVAIIALMSALVLNSIASARMKANDTKIAEDLREFRRAAELYYNDNRVYPPTYTGATINNQETVLATNNVQKSSWAHKLAFFVKTAEAQALTSTHTITALCKNFDNAAIAMVNRKYLASVPVHPYDNDSAGVCYKAVRSANGSTFSGYGELTTQVDITNPNDPSGVRKMNKRSGFIAGDTSSDGINSLATVTKANDPFNIEIVYPAGIDGKSPAVVVGGNTLTHLVTVDRVDGITSGASAPSCGSGQAFDINTSSCRSLFVASRNNSSTCQSPQVPDPYGDNCVGAGGVIIPNCPNGQVRNVNTGVCGCEHGYDANGACLLLVSGVCPVGYVLASNMCVSSNSQVGYCPSGATYTSNGLCQNPTTPSIYLCPVGKSFNLDGNQGTVNGACSVVGNLGNDIVPGPIQIINLPILTPIYTCTDQSGNPIPGCILRI